VTKAPATATPLPSDMVRAALLPIFLTLVACSGPEEGASRDEARQLDEAAAAIDVNASLFDNEAEAEND
jgi:hypothetical protein